MKIPTRRKTPTVKIDDVLIGSQAPIVVQSMTDTPTANIKKTLAQTIELIDAGSELVRWTINDDDAAKASVELINDLRALGHTTPIIGDFHYNGHLLLSNNPECAKLLSKYRINPGNIGSGNIHDNNFETFIKIAIDNNKPVRIGVNWGSLDKEILAKAMDHNQKSKTPKTNNEVVCDAMVQSALDSAEAAVKLGLDKDKIILSAKTSVVQDMVAVNLKLAQSCDYAIHLGLTEAGSDIQGIASSTAALAILLQQGIGDTIRVSLTPQPNIKRQKEVEACKTILQSLGLRYFKPTVTSCPGCGRTSSNYFQVLAQDINDHIEKQLPKWKEKFDGIEKCKIAVMGCVVNGPGESKHADIGISLPGTSERPMAPVYADGKQIKVLEGDNIKEEFIMILENYLKERYTDEKYH